MKIKLTESKLKQIVAESVKNVLNEISIDMLDRAEDAAREKGRDYQKDKFAKYGNKKRKEEMCPYEGFSSNVVLTRDRCEVKDNVQLIVYSCGDIVTMRPGGGILTKHNETWPLDNRVKLDSKQLARTVSKWCNKYLSPEGKEKLQGYEDWHNWAFL